MRENQYDQNSTDRIFRLWRLDEDEQKQNIFHRNQKPNNTDNTLPIN